MTFAAAHPPCTPPSLQAPPLLRRLACWIYEGVLLFGLVMVVGLVFSIATDTRNAMQHRHGLQVAVFCALAIYFGYFWCKGQTLAMKTWRIRIVDRRGHRLRWPRALARYVLSWLWFLPPLVALAPLHRPRGEIALFVTGWVAVWAILSRFQHEGQFLHDAWAGTRLVDVAREITS